MLTKGAIGNLINRYRAVLKKCHLMNTFGSLAVASMLVLGGAGAAGAVTISAGTVVTSSIKDSAAQSVIVNGTAENKVKFEKCGINTSFGGILDINHADFTGSSNSNGGAIYVAYPSVLDQEQDAFVPDLTPSSIKNSTFTGNSASSGGAIFNRTSSLTVSDSTFTGNSASGYIMDFNPKPEQNFWWGGGAILNGAVEGSKVITTLNLEGTNTFTDNTGYKAGAIHNTKTQYGAGVVNFNGTAVFSGNKDNNGIASDIYNEGTLNFNTNSKTEMEALVNEGGTITFGDKANLTVSKSFESDNTLTVNNGATANLTGDVSISSVDMNNSYAIDVKKGSTVTLGGEGKNVTLIAKHDENATATGDTRALQNGAGTVVAEGNVVVEAIGSVSSTTTQNDVAIAVDSRNYERKVNGGDTANTGDASLTFKGEKTSIRAEGGMGMVANGVQAVSNGAGSSVIRFSADETSILAKSEAAPVNNWQQGIWAMGVIADGKGAEIVFDGQQASVTSLNKGYTAQAVTGKNGALVTFDGTNDLVADVKSQSNYGTTGLTGNVAIKNGATVNINTAITEDGVGVKNSTGSQANLTLEEGSTLNINVLGSGGWTNDSNNATGTVGVSALNGVTLDGTVDINVKAGQDYEYIDLRDGETKSVVFDKAAADAYADYSDARGLHIFGGSVQAGENSSIDINVSEGYAAAYGISAEDGRDPWGDYPIAGEASKLLGDVTVDVTGKTGAYAVYAADGADLTLGGEGKNVSLKAVATDGEAYSLYVDNKDTKVTVTGASELVGDIFVADSTGSAVINFGENGGSIDGDINFNFSESSIDFGKGDGVINGMVTKGADISGDANITINGGSESGLYDTGKYTVTAGKNIVVTSDAQAVRPQAGYVKLNAGGDISITSTKDDAFFFMPNKGNMDTLKAEEHIAELISGGNVTLTAGGDAFAMVTTTDVTVDAAGDITLTGSGRTAVANRVMSDDIRDTNTAVTIDAGGSVKIQSSILEKNDATDYKSAVIYSQTRDVSIIAGKDITIAETGNRGANAIKLVEGAELSLNAGGNIAITGAIVADKASSIVLEKGDLSVTGGKLAGFTGTYTQTAGSTDLKGASDFFGGTVAINGGSLIVDATQLGKEGDTLAFTTAVKDANIASGSNLIVDFANLEKDTYSLEEYNKAQSALLGEGEGLLTFLNASLEELDGGAQLVVGGTQGTDGSVTLAGNPTIVEDGEAPKDSSTSIPSVPSETVQLVDNATGELLSPEAINVDGQTLAMQSIGVGDDTEDGAALNVLGGSDITFTGDPVVDQKGDPIVVDVNVEGSTLNLGMDGVESDQPADVVLGDVTLGAGAQMNVINSSVQSGELNLGAGASLFLDQSYKSFTSLGAPLAGKAVVGDGSVLVIGDVDKLEENVNKAGFKTSALGSGFVVDSDSAVLALGETIELAPTGSILVDATATSATPVDANSVTFAGKSLLVVNSDVVASANGAIKADGNATLTVKDGAALYIVDAKSGQKYTLVSGFDTAASSVEGWDNVIVNSLSSAQIKVDGDDIVLETVSKDAADVFPGIIPTAGMNEMIATGANAVEAADAGIKFLSRAIEPQYLASTDTVDLVNEVSRAAVTAGVQNTSLRIADAASNTVLDHMSLASNTASVHSDGADFWAAPMYGNLYTSGMATAGSSVRGQFGGLALGADLEAGQFLGGKFRLGAAINGGGGQSETKGTATSTQNDYDFGGLNFYAGWNSGALNVIASVGYGFGNHEVEMGIPVAGVNKAKADIDTSAFTADLRAEYQLKTPYVDILPHAGIRYTALKTDAHDLKANGSVLNSVQSDTQNIVQFPVGVTLSKDFALAGWNVKPSADVSVIPAAGDKKATTKVNFSGLDAWDSVNTRVMDSTSWAGTIGVQAEKGNMTFGLNYGVQASSNETDQNIQVKFGWKF